MATLGLDIGGTRVKAALVDGDACHVGKSGKYTRPDRRRLVEALRQATPAGGFDRVGLCCPGMASVCGTRIEQSVNVPGLCEGTLAELVGEATGRPLAPTRATDAYATTVDVAARLGLRGRTLLLAIGTGVGACVLDRDGDDPRHPGEMLRVDGDSPGHFGQLDVRLEAHPPIGPDGGAGGLEAYLGTRVLRRRPPDSLGVDDKPIRALVRALRIGHALYRPNHIALAGGIGTRLRHLREPLRRAVNTDLTQIAHKDWALHFGEDDYHAARGVARLADG